MLTYKENEVSDKGNFVAMVVAMLLSAFNLTETDTKDYKAIHPVLAVRTFIRSLGNAETKALRVDATAKLIAEGAEEGEELTKRVNAENKRDGVRRDTAILQRLSANAVALGFEPIHLTDKMEKRLTSLLKASVNYDGHVTRSMLNDAFEQITAHIVANPASTISVESLGITLERPTAREQLTATAKTATAN